MRHKLVVTTAAGFALAGSVFGDGSYRQTTRVTGGIAVQAARLAGPFMPQAKGLMDPKTETVMVRGNRMVTATERGLTIWDIDRQTMTTTDNQKREYSVITFQQMQEATRKMLEQPQRQAPAREANPDTPKFTTEVKVDNTGAVKQIGGVTARETVLTLKVKTTDPKTGNSVDMLCSMDVWKAESAPGYDEVRDFYRRLGEKMGANLEAQKAAAAFASQAGAAEGMAALFQEAGKIKGFPVLEVTRIKLDGMPSGTATNAAAANTSNQQPGPDNSAAQQAAAAQLAKLGALGGMLGRSGLGSFGKKKAADASTPSQNTPSAENTDPGVLSETTTERSDFSTAPVMQSQFEVPAGYKEVPSPMLRYSK